MDHSTTFNNSPPENQTKEEKMAWAEENGYDYRESDGLFSRHADSENPEDPDGILIIMVSQRFPKFKELCFMTHIQKCCKMTEIWKKHFGENGERGSSQIREVKRDDVAGTITIVQSNSAEEVLKSISKKITKHSFNNMNRWLESGDVRYLDWCEDVLLWMTLNQLINNVSLPCMSIRRMRELGGENWRKFLESKQKYMRDAGEEEWKVFNIT
jgi:hypothetical protein